MNASSQAILSQLIGYADIIILAVLLISMVMSLWRGFVREALSLVIWIAAFWIAIHFYPDVSNYLVEKISTPGLRMMVAFSVLFFGTLIIGGIVSYCIIHLIKKTGLSGTDRMLGAGFGLLRGIVIVALGIMGADMLHLSSDPKWQNSHFIPLFQQVADWLKQVIPHAVGSVIGS